MDLDTDSDSDINPLPGMPSNNQPYPNCCRWHLTEARCRYKWQPQSLCAPFSIRVASTNFYSPTEGTLNDGFGPRIQLHSPVPACVVLPSPTIIPPSTLDTQSSPTSVTCVVQVSRTVTPPPTVNAQFASATSEASQQRWYAITKGHSICVVQGWSVHH